MSLTGNKSDRDKLAMLSPQALEAVEAILHSEESVLWTGKPIPTAAWADAMAGNITSRRACVILYAITALLSLCLLVPMVLILLVGIVELFKGNIDWMFVLMLPIFIPIFLIIFIPLLLCIFFPLLSIWQARYQSYVLTNRQVIFVSEFNKDITLKRTDLADTELPWVSRKRNDGLGNIIFGGYIIMTSSGDGGDSSASIDYGFSACPEAEQVVRLITKAREQRLSKREQEDIEEMQQDYQAWLRRNGRL